MKKIFEKENRYIFFNSLLCSLLIAFIPMQFFNYYNVKFNDRIIGEMVLKNFNTTMFINSLYLTLFIFFPLLLFVCFKIFQRLYDVSCEDVCKLNKQIVFFGLISYFFGFLNKQNIYNSFFLSFILCAVTILNLILYRWSKKKKVNHTDLFQWVTLISIPFAIVSSLLINKVHIFSFNGHIIFSTTYIGFVLIIYILCCLKGFDFNKLTKSSIVFLSSLIVHPLYLEFYNILNQYNIVISHKSIVLILIYFLLFLTTICYYRFMKKQDKFDYKKYYFVIIIIGLSLLSATNNLINVIDTDFFESSNHGLSIYELFKYGKIPIIENFDAHLLSREILGILYGILNQDSFGAIFNIYSSYQFVILYIVVYFLIKYFLGRDYAFLSVLIIPFTKDSSLNDMFVGLIAIFTILNAINKKSFKSFLIFWLSLAMICLYRLDIGFSISMSCVVVLIYLLIIDLKKYNIKSIIYSFLVIAASFLFFYVLMCVLKNVNPITRLIEFLKISLSNDNWAYTSLGNANSYAYYLYYYIVPILMIISLLYLLISKYKKYDTQSVILILLGLYYIFNFQRGLVRHSLLENTVTYLLGYSLLYFSFFIFYVLCKKEKKIIPIVMYTLLLVISSLSINLNFEDYKPLINKAADKEFNYLIENQVSEKKVKRVVLSDKMSDEFRDLKKVLSLLLSKNETYFDFSNQTLLYALLDYEKPVYVNQSPGLLSGEYSQQLFIDEIKNFKGNIPIALKARNKDLSTGLDGVYNSVRYYLLSEYLYNNYMLLSNVNDYEIWVKKDYYEKAKEILKNNDIEIYEDNNIEYEKEAIDLMYIPYVWGQENKKSKVIQKLDVNENDNISYLNLKNRKINKTKGNYLILNIDNAVNDTYVLCNAISNGHIVDRIKFYVPKGKNIYKVRISSFYSWYFNDVDSFELLADEKLIVKDAYISQGDTIK